ncbi:MAG: hypothetical protein ACKPKO_14230, partial [Candidatus Fonsibacter sp.]
VRKMREMTIIMCTLSVSDVHVANSSRFGVFYGSRELSFFPFPLPLPLFLPFPLPPLPLPGAPRAESTSKAPLVIDFR